MRKNKGMNLGDLMEDSLFHFVLAHSFSERTPAASGGCMSPVILLCDLCGKFFSEPSVAERFNPWWL